MKLQDYAEDLAYDTVFWLQGLENPDYPVEELGRLSMDVSRKFRALAIVMLLVTGDSDLFHHNLIRSGRARQLYLRRLYAARIERDHHRASGRYAPLLDLIAAGDLDRASEIVRLSPTNLQAGSEYEDDYFFAQLVSRFIQQPEEEEIQALLERFEEYQDGDSSARLSVTNALFERDQSAFDDAFESLLIERESEVQKDRERGQLEDVVIIAERQVFVEGLALLRLAGLRGINTGEEYRFCPSLARTPMKRPFPGE